MKLKLLVTAFALTIPALAPTQCYELTTKLRAPGGTPVERSLHGTIHQLPAK